ncbi:MAG TPA: flagellar biosynthesis protein FlhB [Rhodobacteraceae bacterium]|nr:flagellar biosynthesis protein FlhB [Paracoccaceae bacterium]
MADDKNNDEKPHEPTQKRLDDARRKGEIAKSTDLSTAATYGSILLTAMVFGASSLEKLTGLLAGLINQFSTKSLFGESGIGGEDSPGLIVAFAQQIFPWFALPMVAVVIVIAAQRGFVFAPDKLKPKLNRVSVMASARNKFGRAGLFEFGKSFAKLVIYSVILSVFLWRELPAMMRMMASDPSVIPGMIFEMSVRFLVVVFLISAMIGALDFIWQKQEHLRKNRMSHKEMTDEVKQNEGDPHMKNQRRQRGYEIAMNQMLADVPDADVVLVNPTHFAVALRWDRSAGAAPVCVAKGTDEIAARIREVAAESGVPVHRDPPAARAIFASVEIGEEIHPAHYQAVAAAIRFAEKMRQRAKKAWRNE